MSATGRKAVSSLSDNVLLSFGGLSAARRKLSPDMLFVTFT